MRHERPLEELVGAVERALRLDEIGVGLLDVRRLLDLGQVLRIGRAVLRQRPRQRRLLLFEAVLLLLVVELDQDLAGFDTIAKVREDRPHAAVGFRRNDDLVHCSQSTDDVDRAADGILLNGSDGHFFRRVLAIAGLGGLCLRTTCRDERSADDE